MIVSTIKIISRVLSVILSSEISSGLSMTKNTVDDCQMVRNRKPPGSKFPQYQHDCQYHQDNIKGPISNFIIRDFFWAFDDKKYSRTAELIV